MTQRDEEIGPAEEHGEASVTKGEMTSDVEDERGQEEQEASDLGY